MLFYSSLCYVKRLLEAWEGFQKILWGASEKIEKKEMDEKDQKYFGVSTFVRLQVVLLHLDWLNKLNSLSIC